MNTLQDLKEKTRGKPDKAVLEHEETEIVAEIESETGKLQSPLQSLEHKLHNLVYWFIMPVFAFANAGVQFIGKPVTNLNLSLAIMAGLVIGKAVGITAFSLGSNKAGFTEHLEGSNSKQLFSLSFLGGLGFTMSLFIANLTFEPGDPRLDAAKIGILSGSLIAGVVGYVLLNKTIPKPGKLKK